MAKLNGFDKFVFFLNSLLATGLLLSYILPYVPPKSFPLLSVLSLGVPLLILSNVVFLVYWLIRLKRYFLLSLIILILGYNYNSSLYKFTAAKDEASKQDVSFMSYNVRMFNSYDWTSQKNIPEKITNFVKEKNPDILYMQEYCRGLTSLTQLYPYHFIVSKDKNSEFGSAIFSKYPILKKHSLNFPQDGNNNAIYADIVVSNDTLRLFNVHFQSLRIQPQLGKLKDQDSKQLLGRIGQGFAMQQDQSEMMMKEVNASPYPVIIGGDFNNTSFSYNYEEVKNEGKIEFQDAFLEAGHGFGQSFDLNYFPLRIDFMLMHPKIEITSFKRFKVPYSDHFPILSHFKLSS